VKLSAIALLFVFIVFSLIGSSGTGHADSQVVTVTATVLSGNHCFFTSKTASLAFGNLDPSDPVDREVTTSITFRCPGREPQTTFAVSDDHGLHETGPDAPRMKHQSSTDYLPYTLTLTPTSGTIARNTGGTLAISGTVKGADYQDAVPGNYSDTVVISIAP
jgi:spore coat protein U-like protein